jgi:hypothetical protein
MRENVGCSAIEYLGVVAVLASALLGRTARAIDLRQVALMYLQRHGVPCVAVLRIDSTADMDEVASCQDGRKWVLFWLEDEIAYLNPQTRELYKWAQTHTGQSRSSTVATQFFRAKAHRN